MKRLHLSLGLALLLLVACAPNQDELRKKITDEEIALSMIDIASDDERAQGLVNLYAQYADAFPNDSSTVAVYLMKAADVSGNLGDTEEAVHYIDRILEDYSDACEDIAMCYFLKGHFYELGERYDDALAAYNAYLELFPDHYLAEDLRKMLPYIGHPAEELFEMIMSRANDKNIVAE